MHEKISNNERAPLLNNAQLNEWKHNVSYSNSDDQDMENTLENLNFASGYQISNI